jgi:hypothetical protein
MLESLGEVLQLIQEYGADKVFMLIFFLLYRNSQSRIATIQEERLDDARQTLHVIMESKHVVSAMMEANKELSRRLETWVLQDNDNEEAEEN